MPKKRPSQQLSEQASFLASQTQSNPVDVPIDTFDVTAETQHLPISNTNSPYSGSTDFTMCPLLGGLSLAMASLAPACLPVPALRSNTSSVNWPLSSPVRTDNLPHSPAARQTCKDSFANSPTLPPARRSGRFLTKHAQVTLISLWTDHACAWMPCSQLRSLQWKRRRLCQTGSCQRSHHQRAPAPTGGLLKATIPAGVKAILSLRVKDKRLLSYQLSRRLKLGTSKVRNLNGVQLWSISLADRTKLRMKIFVLVLSLTLTPHPSKLSVRRREVTMPVSCSAPSQNVNNSLLLVQGKVFNLLQIIHFAVRKSAEVFVRQGRTFDERQTEKL